jgi:hypothetical protein
VTATKGTDTATHAGVLVFAGDIRRDDIALDDCVLPPNIAPQPQPQNVCAGSTATFTVTATGCGGTLLYQWQKNGANLSEGGHYSGTTTATLTVSNVDAGDVGDYRCAVTNPAGSTYSNTAALTLKTATSVTQQPVAQNVCPNSTATFTTAATGDGTVTYQWQKNSVNLSNGGHYSGVTTATLTISSTSSADAADYRCVVTAGCGSATSNAVALTLKAATAITQQPAAQHVCPGGTATFTVVATGDGTLSYQWRKGAGSLADGGHYSGVTTATVTVSGVDGSDVSPSYQCLVTAGCGSAMTNETLLALKTATSISQHPSAQELCPGSTATFTVGATGDGTVTYQWQKNGVDLPDGGHYSGATTATLTISGTNSADAADYRCVVTAGCGSQTSNAAALTLRPLVAADLDQDCYVDAADYAVFETCVSGPGISFAGGCAAADFDADNDIDQTDFGLLQRCVSGENVSPDPNCMN